MKFRISLLLELTISLFIVLLLAGCFGDGGSSSAYDGTWQVGYVDTAFVPPAAVSGATVICAVSTPLPTLTLANGIGSTTQYNYCDQVLAGTPMPGYTEVYIYLIHVAITPSTGAVSAIVNGGTLSGQCISTHGCAARVGTATLSLTR